ncbi:MAG: hypothetical protein ACR2P0_03635 [Acidimicrobiales bacterium]
MRRRREPTSDDPLFDPETESDIEDFGDTGRDHFERAFAEVEGPHVDQLGAQTEGERRDADRNLLGPERRRRTIVTLLVVVALSGGGLAAATSFGWLAVDPGGSDLEEAIGTILVPPGSPRTYEVADEDPERVEGRALDRAYGRRSTNDGLETLGPANAESLHLDASMATVIWGQHLHVAIVGPGVAEAQCAVASLVAEDLRVADVAAFGPDCPEDLLVTGDRSACASPSMVLLELWPPDVIDPTSGAQSGGVSGPVAGTRARLVRTDVNDWSDVSFRSDAPSDSYEVSLTTVVGAPGQTLRVDTGIHQGSCQLVDRSGVDLRLL